MHYINTSLKTATTDIHTSIQTNPAAEEGGIQGKSHRVHSRVQVSCGLQAAAEEKQMCQ